MKLRSATPASLSFIARVAIVFLVIVTAFAVPIQLATRANADEYDDRINALQQDLDEYSAEAEKLSKQADTYQAKLDKLTNERKQIEAEIELSQAKYDKLVAQIDETEAKISDNQDGLGQTLADLYVDGQISPIEMLASSNNVSEYLDKQAYRESVQNQLTSTIKQIKELKAQLEEQKKDAKRTLDDQKTQQKALAAKEQEQQNLVNQTKGQEAAYQDLIAKRQAEIKKVQAEQAAYFASLQSSGNVTVVAGDPNKGGYPANLANNPQDSVVDPWGMYNRECVSYVAWKVHERYGNMPYWGGIGNAWQWSFSGYHEGGVRVFYNSGNWHTANTDSYGVPSGTMAREGSVGIINATPDNPYGHAALVEAVLPDNQILISQYNYYNAGGSGWGHYSEMIVSVSFFDRYIYFGEW